LKQIRGAFRNEIRRETAKSYTDWGFTSWHLKTGVRSEHRELLANGGVVPLHPGSYPDSSLMGSLVVSSRLSALVLVAAMLSFKLPQAQAVPLTVRLKEAES
jgi:hypothetical protein